MTSRIVDVCKPLIGVVHLPPLPGSPGYARRPYPMVHGKTWGFNDIVEYAVGEALKYEEAGFDAVIVENYGDKPYSMRASPGQVAALSVVAREVAKSVSMPVGVNLLRNSGYEIIYVAYVSRSKFIRINSLCESRVTGEGIMRPAAYDVARAVSELNLYSDLFRGDFTILADVDVKHSRPLGSRYDVREATRDCIERSGLQLGAIIATGSHTGEEPEPGYVEEIASVARSLNVKVFVGSGVSLDNLPSYWKAADGFIVGSSVKIGGITENPVSVEKAKSMVKLAQHYRKLTKC
ncbi:MAG: BtpA/SgcQ family protein [Desulfurococcales archaeon]|nr:BtpA/SgcQ family protein [Desulfurococcales archaeon]